MSISRTIEKADEYLERLARSFLTYEHDGKMVDFTSKKLLKALDKAKQPYDWEETLNSLTAEEFDNADSSFNNDLVLEQNLARFKREPETGEEIEGIYEDRYELPLSGIRMETAEKEADHE